MFAESSRYASVPRGIARARDGREVAVVRLRRPASPPSKLHRVAQNHRLDTLAQRHFDDPTRFWRIADANTELEANELVAEPGRFIRIPEV